MTESVTDTETGSAADSVADPIGDLIARVARGDRAAFGALYAATSAKLFGICLHVLDDRAQAEDALKDVYVRIWQHAASFAGDGARPLSWLSAIARSDAIDRRRAGASDPADVDAAPESADGIEPASPPAALFSALEDRLFANEAPATPALGPDLFHSLAVWRGLALGAVAVAIVFAGLFVNGLRAPDAPGTPIGATYVADLTGETDAVRLVALYDAESGTLRVNRVAGIAAEGRSFELWLIDGDKDPVSLGVLSDGATATIAVPETLGADLVAGILAISDEPAGGSPSGLPTGAILAAGKVVAI